MIKLNSPSPTTINFVCSSQDEIDFCIAHKDEIFNDFIRHQTRGKFKTLEEYVQWFCEFPEFGTITIKAKWNQTKEWMLEWDMILISKLQFMFNKAYNESMNKKENKC